MREGWHRPPVAALSTLSPSLGTGLGRGSASKVRPGGAQGDPQPRGPTPSPGIVRSPGTWLGPEGVPQSAGRWGSPAPRPREGTGRLEAAGGDGSGPRPGPGSPRAPSGPPSSGGAERPRFRGNRAAPAGGGVPSRGQWAPVDAPRPGGGGARPGGLGRGGTQLGMLSRGGQPSPPALCSRRWEAAPRWVPPSCRWARTRLARGRSPPPGPGAAGAEPPPPGRLDRLPLDPPQ